MIKVDVIGGSGFIGTCLMNRLRSNGIESRIIDRVPSETFPALASMADVRSLEQLRESISIGSVIINLAAEHRDDVEPLSLYEEVNVHGAKNICRIATEKEVKTIIFTSTVAVYGFAPIGTSESGPIAPFNKYGQTKYEAEQVFMSWQAEAPEVRTLVVIRPTVVFGEKNRGNVYNLLRQIASGKFIMIGQGLNRKSLAYVENLAAFIQHTLSFKPGVHIFNYADKPDFTMEQLVTNVNKILGRSYKSKIRLPYWFGITIGKLFDLISHISGKKLAISSIRVKKFCANSVYESVIDSTGFIPPVSIMAALERTVRYEFIENEKSD